MSTSVRPNHTLRLDGEKLKTSFRPPVTALDRAELHTFLEGKQCTRTAMNSDLKDEGDGNSTSSLHDSGFKVVDFGREPSFTGNASVELFER